MPIMASAAANVESTLAFSLSVKLVDIVRNLRSSGISSSGGGSDPRDATLFLCIGILFLSAVPTFFPTNNLAKKKAGKRKGGFLKTAAVVGRDMLSLASEVLVLAFSRLVMQQVRLSRFDMDPITPAGVAVFLYAQRILEIMFVGIILSCCLTTFLPTFERESILQRMRGGMRTGSLMGRQLNSIVVNMQVSAEKYIESILYARKHVLEVTVIEKPSVCTVIDSEVKIIESLLYALNPKQRTFADTIASVIPDAQTRRMVVLLGLCMLPSIASMVSSSSSSSLSSSIESIGSFFLMDGQHNKQNKTQGKWRTYTNVLAKIWITGLSMAWINTALGFIIPSSSSSSRLDAFDTWISLVSTICLAILMQALHPLFPGLDVFQGYIEWSVASSALGYFTQSGKFGGRSGTLQVVVCSSLLFYCIDALQRDLQRSELKNHFLKKSPPGISYTLQTVQSITVIVCTNSLVAFAMELVSPSSSSSSSSSSFSPASLKSKSPAAVASSLATVVAGLVVAKTVMQVVEGCAVKK